jgi:hypothetical protein
MPPGGNFSFSGRHATAVCGLGEKARLRPDPAELVMYVGRADSGAELRLVIAAEPVRRILGLLGIDRLVNGH